MRRGMTDLGERIAQNPLVALGVGIVVGLWIVGKLAGQTDNRLDEELLAQLHEQQAQQLREMYERERQRIHERNDSLYDLISELNREIIELRKKVEHEQ